jgi:hypothetical protein
MSLTEETADEASAAVLVRSYFGLVERQASLTGLEMLAGMKTQIDELIVALVKVARQEESTWDEIGRALNVTRQTAYMRYKELTGR